MQAEYTDGKGLDWQSFTHDLPNPAVALTLLTPESLVLSLPTLTEWLAFLCRWHLWDPLALFPQLRDSLCCPACGKAGVLTADGWADLPRKVADLTGLILLLSRKLKHQDCPSAGGKLSCLGNFHSVMFVKVLNFM